MIACFGLPAITVVAIVALVLWVCWTLAYGLGGRDEAWRMLDQREKERQQ
jgi:hypothetical protein